jgi:transcriptional regulator with XRE-family HTH domain
MSAREILSSNLKLLMDSYPEIGSQKLLFKTTGVTTSTVGRIKRAEVSATIDNIEALAKAFKITAYDMLDPRLRERIKGTGEPSAREQAAALAAEIQDANLNEKQLTILANTLAAMRSQ